MESHRNGDLLLLLKFRLVIHDGKLIRLGYLIHLKGKVVPDFVVQLLFPNREIGGG